MNERLHVYGTRVRKGTELFLLESTTLLLQSSVVTLAIYLRPPPPERPPPERPPTPERPPPPERLPASERTFALAAGRL